MLGVSGRAYRIRKNYIYQFPSKDTGKEVQRDVIFEDHSFGFYQPVPAGIQVFTQAMFSNNRRHQVVANERITISNIADPEETEVQIEWVTSRGEIKREFVFKAGEQILNAIPMTPGEESPCIQAGYKVSDIYFDFGERGGFYLNVGFESFVPVLQESGGMKYELFSQSCYELEAEAVNFL